MPVLRRSRHLSQRIPPDVQARAREAGSKRTDWYAGRLKTPDGSSSSRQRLAADSDRRRLRAATTAHYKEKGTQAKQGAIRQARAFFGRRLPKLRARHPE